MSKKSEKENPFLGRWRIISMEQWDQDYVDEEEEGYIEFDSKDLGSFHFGYVHGSMDCQLTTREGDPAVEWSWEGNDEMDESGQLCTVEPVEPETLEDGDIVLCKVNGNQYLHLIKAIQGKRFQIGNNRGRINGWIGEKGIYGKCTKVE